MAVILVMYMGSHDSNGKQSSYRAGSGEGMKHEVEQLQNSPNKPLLLSVRLLKKAQKSQHLKLGI